MSFQEKILNLRSEIDMVLDKVVGGRVILPDTPYYGNVGDMMIWQGTEDWLRRSCRKILSQSSNKTFLYQEIDKDVTIVLMGGGNFGDLWRIHQDDRMRIIRRYPRNRIVMLPQSVRYEDKNLITQDAEICSAHHDLHLCARDLRSYEFLSHYFPKNSIYLVPDLSFAVDPSRVNNYIQKANSDRLLYLRREDKELSKTSPLSFPGAEDIGDWPSLTADYKRFDYFRKSYGLSNRLRTIPFLRRMVNKSIDIGAVKFLRDSLVKDGCRFLSSYSGIVTTRLHAMILGGMLQKKVGFIDDANGKISSFVETWLKDVEGLTEYGG